MELGSLLTGLWLGQQRNEDTISNLKWCLSLTPDQSFPSAFGVSYEAPSSNETHTPFLVPLKGEFQSNNRSLMLTKKTGDIVTQYEGQLQWCVDSGEWSVVGKWRSDDDKQGVFGLCREADAMNVVCGLWLGRSVPDPSLLPFCIPTNPIKWSLVLIMNVSDVFSVFGGGFFDDSGDVPNSPVLCYSLQGTWNQDMSVNIVKHYEDRSLGHEVEYKGTVSVDEEGLHWIKGTWNNTMAGSFGSFECRQCVSAGAISSGVCLCDHCHCVIPPGKLRWNCVQCVPSWNACDPCYNSSESRSNGRGGSENMSKHPHMLSPETVYNVKKVEGESCAELMWNAFNTFSSLPCLGSGPPPFHYSSYSEIASTALNFACALRRWGCKSNTLVVVCMDASPMCATVLMGCVLNGCAVVPVSSLYGAETLAYILNKVEAAVFIVDSQAKSMMLSAIRKVRITPRLIVEAILTFVEAEQLSTASSTFREGMPLLVSVKLPAFLQAGAQARVSSPFTLPKRSSTDVVAVLFTSGSTGTPKGAVFPERLALPRGPITAVQPFVRLDFQTFDPAFLLSLLSTVRCGGRRAFSSISGVLEDLPHVRPTHLGATPTFWNMLHQLYLSEQKTCEQLKDILGNRLHVATAGGAAISQEVLKFIREELGIDLVDNYGARETGGIAREGLVYPGVEIELLPVPELGYLPSSSPSQGEICVFSPQVIPEYYNDDELNASSFIEVRGKRFYRTGDVGELTTTSAGTHLRIIDRCSSFFKLAQGEWVSPTHIETIFELAPFIQQIFVWGSSSLSHCVAVVVCAPCAREWDATKLLHEMRHWAAHHFLKPFEIPQAVVIERGEREDNGEQGERKREEEEKKAKGGEEGNKDSVSTKRNKQEDEKKDREKGEEVWSERNGLLTATMKKNRPLLLMRYREQLINLSASSSSLLSSSSSSSCETLSPALEQVLKQVCPGVTFSASSTLAQLGVDSLSIALFRNLLPTAKKLSLETLFSYDLGHLSYLLSSSSLSSSASSSSAASLFSPPSIDWSLESRLMSFPSSISSTVPSASFPPSISLTASSPPRIFLTGCTGFLGPVLLAELLKRRTHNTVTDTSATTTTTPTIIVCLVRASDEQQGFARVKECLVDAGCWEAEYAARITIVAGDLAKPLFGYSSDQFQNLAHGVTEVIHNGAQVNMLLPYSALKLANVEGTRTAIQLAHLAHATFHFVSSVSALGPTPETSREDWLTLSDALINAKEPYGQTKVMSERLLQEAHRKYKMKVRIYRPSVICTHTQTGFTNIRDFTVLLLATIVSLKCVVEGSTLQFRWIPVDEVAEKIVSVLCTQSNEQLVVQNMIGNNVSLLSLVSAMHRFFVVEPVTLKEWRSRVGLLDRSHPAYALRSVFATMNFFPSALAKQGNSHLCIDDLGDKMIGYLKRWKLVPCVTYCEVVACFNLSVLKCFQCGFLTCSDCDRRHLCSHT